MHLQMTPTSSPQLLSPDQAGRDRLLTRSGDLMAQLDGLARLFRPTPLVHLDDPDLELCAKLEYFNPIGSVKDRPAYWILRAAAARGEIDERTTIVESSSGNFALALASFCRFLGLPFIPVIDPNVPAASEMFLRGNCAEVVKVEERDDTGGFLKTRLAAVERIRARSSNVFWTRQYENLDGVEAHYMLTGREIVDQTSELDFVFVAVSTLSTIAGVSQRLKESFPRVTVVAVDSVGSVIFGGPPSTRHISGLGSSIVPPLVASSSIDEVVMVPEQASAAACQELMRRHGLFVGGSSGAAYAAIKRHLPTIRGGRKPRVLFLCADRGTPYADTIFNQEWSRRLT
jgi:N-(2-amino-2-carboxyethyl)-L-glutamate synthase